MPQDSEDWNIAAEFQRQLMVFGQARSPLEIQIDRERIVIAGGQMFRIPANWTFQQFLISYGINKLGTAWSESNLLNRTHSHRHPLAEHIIEGLSGSRPTRQVSGGFVEYSMNGHMYAFLSFAYDMFTLADNALVQDRLLSRIRHATQYQGARYEIFVAASLLRAGFKIDFEDESDSQQSHCEFVATYKKSGKQFSVEAKSRHRNARVPKEASAINAGMYRLLQNALAKSAGHERIIYADVNLPSDDKPLFEQDWHKEVMSTLTELEERQRQHNPWPQAIIFFTNRKTSPWPSSEGDRGTVLLTAINHAQFKSPDRRAVEDRYPELGKLFHATNNLSIPPRHFLGQSIKGISRAR